MATIDPKNPAQGMYFDVSDDFYFSLPFVSASVLKMARRSMAHARWALTEKFADKKAFRVGSMVDCRLLQPKELHQKFIVKPDSINRRGAANQTAYDDWMNDVSGAGLKVVSQAEWDEAETVAEAALANPRLEGLLGRAGEAQAVVVWFEVEANLWCKAKLDRFVAGTIAFEMKTTVDASARKFASDAAKYGYHIGGGWYTRGLRAVTGVETPPIFAAIEKTAPWPVSIYRMRDDDLKAGEGMAVAMLKQIAECNRTGVWPEYQTQIETLELPDWAVREAHLASYVPSDENDESEPGPF